MILTTLLLLIGLELKHFIADYVLQTPKMISGKGSLLRPGGYVHAAIHALGSLIVLLVFGIPAMTVAILVAGEFVLHYLLDFAKVHYSRAAHLGTRPQLFWALHGFDQFLHHLTYAGMTYVAVTALPGA